MFACVGVSYHTATAEIRDRVSFTDDSGRAFQALLAARGIAESLVLSTCNRCEVFVCCSPENVELCSELFTENFQDVQFGAALVVRTGEDALDYLFRIAAGLDSMILGEYQILGQVKAAYASARANGRVGKTLDRILRDAISCAKRVKTELDIGAVPPSVCRAGVECVDRLAGIAGKRVFVIGSGRTGSLAAHLVRQLGAHSIAVCNRSPERTRRLVEEVSATTVDYAARYETISASDIVISATASPHVVVQKDLLRLTHPTVFLDLASPRDVEPTVANDPRVTLVSIDTIGELAAGDRAERERLVAKGREVVRSWVSETAPVAQEIRAE